MSSPATVDLKRGRRGIALIAVAVSLLVCGRPSQGDEKPLRSAGRWGGAEYSVALPQAVTFYSMPLTITVKNVGSKTEMCGDVGPGPLVRMSLKRIGRTEEIVPYTPAGNNFFGDNIMRTSFGFIGLRPGEDHTWHTNLIEHFAPLSRGIYELHVWRHDGTRILEPLRFEIPW